MHKIILIVLVVSLLIFCIFWVYPEKHGIPAEGSLQSQDLASATSKVQIQVEEDSVGKSVYGESSGAVQTLLTAQELFEIARELRLCKSTPGSDTELSLWLDNANQAGEPSEYVEDVLARYERCSKHAATEQNYVVLLLKAAEQGSDDAVSELWAIADPEYFESMGFKQLSRDELIAERAVFTKKKYELAHAAALLGGEQSLERLIKGYQHFDLVTNGQSYYKSVAYADFAMSITQNNDFYRKVDWIKQRISKGMSHDELEQARTLTEKLLAEAVDGRN